MRIAVVHSFYRSSEPSGENSAVIAQVAALRSAAGYQAVLFGKYTDDESRKSFYKLRSAMAAAGLHGPSPLRDIRSFKPEVIHLHNLFPNFGTSWIRGTDVPIVATAHNYRLVCSAATLSRNGKFCDDCMEKGSHNALRHACYRDSRIATAPLAWATRRSGRKNPVIANVDKLITLNPRATNIFGGIVGRDRVCEIPNFVEVRGGPAATSTESDGNFLFVGRISEEKGADWLVRNWPADERLSIVGSGPMEQRVRQIADGSGINFVGRLDNASTVNLMKRATAVVIPSLWLEGLPTVALEALAVGTPVLVSNRCGAASSLAVGGAGVIFDPDDGSVGLKAALRELRTNIARRRQAAKSQYNAQYSRDSWLAKVTRLYGELVNR